jgi:type II secretory pathway pseudopilin PulG
MKNAASPSLHPSSFILHPSRRKHRGLSLVETMISLVITATLLTAVGAAYTGSVQAIQINDQFFRATQTARVSLNQLMAELRQCSVAEVHPTTLNVIPSTGQAKSYTYDAANQKLLLAVTNATTGVTTNYTLGSHITSLAFGGDGTNVSITMTVTAGKNSITLGGSVVPRRTVVYK